MAMKSNFMETSKLYNYLRTNGKRWNFTWEKAHARTDVYFFSRGSVRIIVTIRLRTMGSIISKSGRCMYNILIYSTSQGTDALPPPFVELLGT